jgi:hypothetical protein
MNTDAMEMKMIEQAQAESALVELADLQLAWVGGGTGEVVIA